MALAFFRRRQKMVIIIMAILMVSFLIGFQGFETVLHKDPGKRTIGKTRNGKITYDDLVAAENDLRLLSYVNYADMDFQLLRANDQPVLVYALLLREAQDAHVRVSDEELGGFLVRKGLVGAQLQSFVAELKSFLGERVTEQNIRDAVARWMKIARLSNESLSVPPVSRLEVERLFCDLTEKIKLNVVTIRDEDFLDQAGEPNEEALAAQFAEFRTLAPGRYSNTNPFGFGYLQPDRVRILYLLVRQDVVRRATRPRDETVRDYYRRHSAELVKKVPVEPAGAPAGASQPASKPTEYREVAMSFAEAKAKIVEKLTEEAVQTKMDELLNRAIALLEEFSRSGQPASVNPYRWVRDRMTAPAEAVLGKRLEGLKIDGEPLERAIEILTEKSGLEVIVFPWGDLGDRKLDPAVKVKLSAGSITLEEALARICEQIKWPKLHWAMSPAFEGVLFSVEGQDGMDFFPVAVTETKLIGAQAMKADPALGPATTASGQPLEAMAFAAEPFAKGRKGGSMLKVNDDGPRMDAGGEGGGKLLWRITEAVTTEAPPRMEAVEGLRERVIKDCTLKAAFELAFKHAEQIKASAAKRGLAAVAKQEKLKVIETGLFARRVAIPQQYIAMAQLRGRQPTPEMFQTLALLPPFTYDLAPVEPLHLASELAHSQFIDAAFLLAPADVEPPYPKEPPAVGVLALRATGEVYVMERADYQPAVWSLYQQHMTDLARQLDELRRWQDKRIWFSDKNVAERMEFKLQAGAEG